MTKKQLFKGIKALILLGIVSFSMVACAPKANKTLIETQSAERPARVPNQSGFDFYALHNYVIDGLMEEETPFFYIVNGSVDISGDNEKKEIVLKCVTMDRTKVEDLDLFLSMAIRLIGDGCAEQDFKYKPATIDKYDGYTYTDFGSVFNTYSLILDCKKQNGEVLRNDNIKPGQKIPVDPRYWSDYE